MKTEHKINILCVVLIIYLKGSRKKKEIAIQFGVYIYFLNL